MRNLIEFVSDTWKEYILMMILVNIFCQFFIWFAYLLGAEYCMVLAWSVISIHGLTWFMTLVVVIGLGLYVLYDTIKDKFDL